MPLTLHTPLIETEAGRIPKFNIEYPNKILSFSSIDLNDETVYTIVTDQATVDLISANPDYGLIADDIY